jgi:hypothetical protein
MIDYKKLKVEQLKKECLKRDIVCKQTKEEMINSLILDDQGKWIYHTTQIKQKNGGYIVQIDYRNKMQLIEMSKNVEKRFCQTMGVYSVGKIWYKCENEFITP